MFVPCNRYMKLRDSAFRFSATNRKLGLSRSEPFYV